MSRTKSALKAHRVSLRRRSINARRTSLMERSVKTIRKTSQPTSDQLRSTVQIIDKNAQRGLLHWRKAARLKSQVMRASQKTTTPAKPAKSPRKASKK